MTDHLPALIVVVPLTAALLLPILAMLSPLLVRVAGTLALLFSFAGAVGVLDRALAQGEWHYYLGGWPPPWGIEYVIDPLGGVMAVLVSLFGLLVSVYSGPYLHDKQPLTQGAFYALFLLLTAGLLGITTTGDVFNLYVFLEIASLSAYALVSFGGNRATVAAFRYLLIGSLAASLYLLGIGLLYAVTGTLNMADLRNLLPPLLGSRPVGVAVALIVVGLGTKMALFPLHSWLPDAYSYAPAPVVAFNSAVMAKVAAYAIFRLLYFVLKPAGPVYVALEVVGWAAAAGILFGSIMAIAQRDFWRMLAYSSVAQMGYIALGFSLGNAMGLYGALLHTISHAVTKGCLFMVAGGVQWQVGARGVVQLARLSRRMPWTTAALVVAALSMVGLPPTAGFFSKWYLVMGSLEMGNWFFVAVLILSSLLTAVYFFRVIENAYVGEDPEEVRETPVTKQEPPPSILVPMLLLGASVVVIGVFSDWIISHVLQFALPKGVPR